MTYDVEPLFGNDEDFDDFIRRRSSIKFIQWSSLIPSA